MYAKVDSSLDFIPRELEVLSFWKENRIFEKSMKNREGAPIYSFYDGPPTANGMPHAGHVLTRAIKDLIPLPHDERVLCSPQGGWDTTACRSSSRLRNASASKERNISKSLASRILSASAKLLSGSIRRNGRKCRSAWGSGLTWIIPTSPTIITISNPSGGRFARSGTGT